MCEEVMEVVRRVDGKSWGERGNVLMLLPVTGRSGGKRKRTVVTITYAMPSC